jgi:hypothetical protein
LQSIDQAGGMATFSKRRLLEWVAIAAKYFHFGITLWYADRNLPLGDARYLLD